MPSVSELRNEAEWRRCRGSGPTDWKACKHFLEAHWFIRHPERGKIKFELREAQEITLKAWLTERYNIVLKARQVGFSTLAAGISFWLIFFHSDKFIIMLSRTERESVKLLQKAKYGYKWLPSWMKVRGPQPLTDHQQKISFDNDSSVESLPSNNDPARGESVYLIIVDEWAFLPNAEEAWASIEPVADVGGRVIGLSTANGSGDFFHSMWVKSETGHSRFKPLFFPWSANTDRGEDWYESKAEELPSWQLHQEYPRSAEEAFIKSGNPVFDTDMLELFDIERGIRGQLIELTARNYEFREGDGPLEIWAFPELGEVYTIGADIAEGLEYGDYSSAHVIDARTGLVVAHWHGHIDPDLFGVELDHLGRWYNGAIIGPEVNNHGLTTAKTLQYLAYPNIYWRTSLDQRTSMQTRQIGWRTTVSSKPLMVDELNKALRDGGCVIKDRYTIAELKTFVRDPNGKMRGSPHDDRVISLSIAQQMRHFAFAKEYQKDDNDGWGTGVWWEQQLQESRQPQDWIIGGQSIRQPA